ncbi:MAG: GNAT family N-acetyltransferase [Anaerolineae bacterium]|nr:GNAT family N-acetyltransferase [Anaerolineae bacterium]
MLTQSNLALRKFQWSDLATIVDLYNLSQANDQLEGRVTLEELENEWRVPTFFPEEDVFVVHNEHGQLIAFISGEKADPLYRGYGWGIVHPDYRRQGLGTELIRKSDANFLTQVAPKIDAPQLIYMQRWVNSAQQDAIALFEAEGYVRVRTFYNMRIALDQPLSPIELPNGFTLRPFDRERDTHAVYNAQQESFEDHWGYIARVPFEEWFTRLTDPKFDPELWLIAYDGDQIAGVSLCSVWGDDIPELAWVNNLGVRRPWRNRGLAKALLQQSFYVFQQRGFTQGGLGVDAANPTGALGLYERAGMHVHRTSYSYRKALRGDSADLFK